MKPKKTVGAHALDLMNKQPDTLDPIEITREATKKYESEIGKCIRQGIKDFGRVDFYVVVEKKKERLMQNVIRQYFIPRKTCPTPHYDQDVYLYHYTTDTLECLWVLPDIQACQLYKEHIPYIDVAEYRLLEYVMDFYEGKLLAFAKRLNGEQVDSLLLEA